MSRSRRRIPILKDWGSCKRVQKRLANQKVRRTLDVPSGCSFKRLYCSWNICDWKTYYPLADALLSWARLNERREKQGRPVVPMLEAIAEWYRMYFWK